MAKISVIIPFFNDLRRLQLCLHALEKQTFPAQDLEVIAVDNGSQDDSSEVKTLFPKVQWLRETSVGSFSARNCGIKHALSPIVAFTDADCIPDPSWLAEANLAIESGHISIVAGRVDYIDPPHRALNLFEIFEEEVFLLHRQAYLVHTLGVAATANLVVCRSAFENVGLFDPDLMSFADGEWIKRATAAGESLGYVASALVKHPRRSDFQAIFKKVRRIAGDKITLIKKQRGSILNLVVDVLRYSILNPRVHIYAARSPKIKGLSNKIRMFLIVESLSFVNTFEKCRVLLGGYTTRG